MGELNDQSYAKLLEAAKGEGEPIRFSDREYEKCREKYIKFNEEEGKMEKIVSQERARAAARPKVILTF